MKKDLKISLLQIAPVWENPAANQKLLERYFTPDSPSTDLVVLPEMFSTGFTRDYTEKSSYPSLEWMKQLSEKQNAYVYGSIAASEDNQAFNRGFWVNPNGTIRSYDKKHLFRYGNEHHTFTAGNSILQVKTEHWTFRPLICYDLRFPVWARNTAPYYDILIYIASWPAVRSEAWKALLKARAIENQCYVIGVNRTGTDGYNLEYSGDSCVIDYKGNVLLNAENREGRFDLNLSYSELHDFRNKFPFLEDADSWSFN